MSFFNTHDMFKKEVSKSDKLHVLTDEEHAGLQSTLIDMIKDIDAVAAKNGIEYTLGGGTALGAIRHKGFIPWDDDVDINVERRYVRNLIFGIKRDFPDKYDIIIPGKTEGYESIFYQIQKKGTLLKESESMSDDISGVKIDAFVLENTFDNVLLRFLHGIMTDAWLFFMSCIRFYERRKEYDRLVSNNTRAKIIIKTKEIIGRLLFAHKKSVYRDLLKIVQACKNNNSKYVTFPSGRKHFFGELTTRREYTDTIRVDFEDTTLPVTSDYDNYLKRLFGDYMTIPDESKRERHLIYSIKL